MKRIKRILVATDTRYDKHPIVDKAAEVAYFNQASLKIVGVLPTVPWLARAVTQECEHMTELLEKEHLDILNRLADPLMKKGLNVETEMLRGKTSIELAREVLRNDHNVLFAVAKGRNSKHNGPYGHTARRLLRKCPCPVWLVTGNTKPEFKHVMGCVDTSTNEPLDVELNDKVYELCESISKYDSGKFSIVHVWSIWNEPMLKDHFGREGLAEQVSIYESLAKRGFDKFLKRQDASMASDNMNLIKGEPCDVIPEFASQNNVDLVVMGTVARSGLFGAVMGNTAEHILNRLECSVLALKPASFRCPISLEEPARLKVPTSAESSGQDMFGPANAGT